MSIEDAIAAVPVDAGEVNLQARTLGDLVGPDVVRAIADAVRAHVRVNSTERLGG